MQPSAMVVSASSDLRADAPDRNRPDRVGFAVAVAWVVLNIWDASPLPYWLSDVTGLHLVTNTTEQRGLLVGFALALAFLIFPSRRIEVPPVADLMLAVLGAMAGSLMWWHYDSISAARANPDNFSLAVALIATLMLIGAAQRVVGWAAAAAVGLLSFQGLFLEALDLARSQSLDQVLYRQWLTTEGVFGIPLGLWGEIGFLFVVLGVGLDLLGVGRLIVRWFLLPLPKSTRAAAQADRHPFARRFWALTLLLLVNLIAGSWLYGDVSVVEAFLGIARGAAFSALIYAVFLAVAWTAANLISEAWQRTALWLGIAGMLFAASQFVTLAGALALTVVLQSIAALLPEGAHSVGSPWLLVVWVIASLPLAQAMFRAKTEARQAAFRAGLALLPVTLLFWGIAVQHTSPSTAALYAILMLAVVLVEDWVVRRRHTAGASFSDACIYPLCHGVARVMVRVVFLAATYGMFIAYAVYWVPLLGLEPS